MLLLACIIIAFVFSGILKPSPKKINLKASNGNKDRLRSEIVNPEFHGFTLQKEPYFLKAKNAHWFEKGIYYLNDVKADITLNNQDILQAISQDAEFLEMENQINLSRSVKLFYNTENSLSTDFLAINIADFSCHNSDFTVVKGKNYEIKSDSFAFASKIMVSNFSGNVDSAFESKDGSFFYVTSENLKIFHNEKKARYIKNAKATKGGVKLLANELLMDYAKMGNEPIKNVEAFENVELTDGKIKVTSEHAKFIPKNNQIIMSKNVVLTRAGTVVKGPKLVYDLNTEIARMGEDQTDKPAEKKRSRIILKTKG